MSPQHCLAITFTRRAAEEMRARLSELLPEAADRIEVTTFHGLGLRILREQHERLGLPRDFGVIDEDTRLSLVKETFGLSERRARRLLGEVSSWRRGQGVGSTQGAEPTAKLQRYEDALRRRNLVDFDDLLALPVELLGEDARLQEQYRNRHRFVAVDEYQDIEDMQYRLLRLLVASDGDIYAIGDPDQAIYGFRGSDVGFFLRFQEDFPAARVVQLSRNYRSTPTIVRGALQAIASTTLVRDRVLASAHDTVSSEPIVIHAAVSARAEADFVVRTIDQLLGGYSYFSLDSGRVGSNDGTDLSFADFAILYRTDAQTEALVEALERAGIPFQKRSHDRLKERGEVRAIIAALRRRPRPTEGGSVRDLVRAAAEQAIEALGSDPGADDERAPELSAHRIRAAVELLEPLALRLGNDLPAFFAELSLGAEVDTWDPRADRVSLLTLHAAKGLEFPVVFVVGCEDGLLPLRWGTGTAEADDASVEEERRLFFVGLTRAQSRVFLSHARKRSRNGKVRKVAPSPFLRDIEEALLERRKAEGMRSGRAAPAQQQLRLL
jgi:superfamily I DNA/RNA helicase